MQDVHFVYNTSLDELIMPEYGRMVQDLVLHCKAIEDPKYRQSFAETVIELMQIMTPYNRNFEEHRKKLWHHFFRIAQYKIDVIPPTGIIPTPENDIIIPEKIEYPHALERNRHYGNYVNAMIQKAITLEDPKKKMAFAVIIASYMKMAFKNWNKEHYVSDEIIKEDLFNMSKGVLEKYLRRQCWKWQLTIPDIKRSDLIIIKVEERIRSIITNPEIKVILRVEDHNK
ncbi:MAG: DUF4290 domain-containing protein [Saprospiraceae bacterium]|nr:DUF4290 domain-containing protein [Candidatus Vicinibacter affinis]